MTRHDRWYRRFLRLFPADFRGDFGDSMRADFDDERRLAAGRGWGAMLRLWTRTLGGFLRVGPREHLAQWTADVRLGLRLAARQPGTTAATALVLALGITGITSSFAVVDAFLLRPLPFADADRLVHVWSTDRPTGQTSLRSAWPDVEAWAGARSVDGIAAFNYTEEDLTDGSRPERLSAGRVTANVFDLLGAEPALGRGFRPGEDRPGAPRVAVLSHGFWQRRYGGAADVLGRAISIGNVPHTVVGVMPPTFMFPIPTTALWLPYALDADRYPYDWRGLQVVARLAPGASRAAALQELESIADAVAREHGAAAGDRGVAFEPLRNALNFADEGFRAGAPILLAASALILLVACANVSSVLLGRALARAREVSVRAAMGASRLRLFRQFMFEGAGLAVAAMALGLVLSQAWLVRMRQMIPLELFRVGDIGLDWRAGLVALGAAAVAVAIAAFLPALRFGRANPAAVLRQEGVATTGSRRALRAQHVLLATQVTLSVALVASAFAALDVVGGLSRTDPGFDRDRVLTMKFILGEERAATGDAIAAFHARLLEEARALPGVEGAALVNHLPLNHEVAQVAYARPEDPPAADGTRRSVIEIVVSPDYFSTMGIAVTDGRAFDARDGRGRPAGAVVNRAFADRLWPGRSPVGRELALGADGHHATIVGVVSDARHWVLTGEDEPIIYRPMAQVPRRHARLIVRTPGDPAGLTDAVQQAVSRVDRTMPLTEIRTLDEVVREFLLPQRAMGTSMAALGVVGLLLMAIGLYGLLALVVGQRRREIGVRMALGASTREVVRSVVASGLRVTALGLVLGLGLAAVLTSLLAGLLPGARLLNPFALAGSTAALLLVAAAAAYVPARRAVRVDPMQTIRDA